MTLTAKRRTQVANKGEYASPITPRLCRTKIDKRMILREVIDRIVVNDNEVSIYGIIPMYEEESGEAQKVSVGSQSS